MRAYTPFVALLAAIVGLCAAGRAFGQLTESNSSTFPYQYNGNVYPVPNYTENGPFQAGPSSDGNVLTYQSPINPNGDGYFVSNDWNSSTISAVTGWTVELRVKIDNDAIQGPRGAMQVATFDNASSASLLAMTIGQNSVGIFNGTPRQYDATDNTDVFHTYRLAELGGGLYDIWRDRVLITPVPVSPGALALNEMYFGNASGALGGPTIHVDYIRFDNTGPYAPVGFLHGDLNGDGLVNTADYDVFKGNWLQVMHGASDFNGDGVVNLSDFVIFKQDYLAQNPGRAADIPVPIPEPSTLLLVAAALSTWCASRRHCAQKTD